jgi:hypothetical protein
VIYAERSEAEKKCIRSGKITWEDMLGRFFWEFYSFLFINFYANHMVILIIN